MTNQEYEAACITQAQVYDKFEGEHRVKQYDAKIAEVEGLLAKLQEDRREIINRYNLNKDYKSRCDEVVLGRGVHNHVRESNT